MQSTLNGYIKQSLVNNAGLEALTDIGGETYRYADVARQIAKFHLLYGELGLKPGDRIALCGKNSSRWAMAFLSAVTYGAVAVPILHEFKPDSVHHLMDHSDSTLAFVDASIWKQLRAEEMPKLRGVIALGDYSALYGADAVTLAAIESVDSLFTSHYGDDFSPEQVTVYEGDENETAVINYTSGSTGFSKGVVLSYRNLWSNIQYCIDGLNYLYPGDGMVCMLPLAHMFGLVIEMTHTFVKGCHIYFITRVPSPRVILEAFGKVKPKLIITVPLVLEKIIKSKVFPVLKKPMMRVALAIPGLKGVIYRKIRRQLIDGFGGNVMQVIIGGAGLNKDVERFLRRIKFPYTVGYGMTECGPLISYAPWDVNRPASCGRVVERMEVKVDSADPINTPGVLWVKGANVMKGYFKNPEATEAVMRDGWMNTGDICTIDADGFIYIRGRDKNMILGPSGQNIYPEEIEMVLNNQPMVNESVVIDDGGKIVALIHPDYEAAEKAGLSEEQIEALMRENVAKTNQIVNAYSRIADMRIQKEEFEKTPKRSIKRYLYQK